MGNERVSTDLADGPGDHEDDSGVNRSSSAVRRRSARVSEAVSAANNATFPIGSIVVQSVAKSLLILIKNGDICRSVCCILIRMTYQARAKLLRSASRDRTHEMISSRLTILDFGRRAGGIRFARNYVNSSDALSRSIGAYLGSDNALPPAKD